MREGRGRKGINWGIKYVMNRKIDKHLSQEGKKNEERKGRWKTMKERKKLTEKREG